MSGRLPLLDRETAAKAAEEAGIHPQMAELSVFRVLLRKPRVAKVVSELLTQLLFRADLDMRLRELIIMRIGWVTGSDYEWTQHWRVATGFGVPADDLLAVRDWEHADRFGDAERAVLAATDETIRDGVISAATWAACEAVLPSEDERLELVATIGCWRFVSSVLRSLEVPLEDGVASWPPDGRVGPRG